MLMDDAQRDDLLAELGLSPAEAASGIVDEIGDVVMAPVVAAVEALGLKEHVRAPEQTLVVPTFGAANFEGMALDSPAECDAAYRHFFDAHKVHRRVSPGYNQALTKNIRTAIRDERERRKGPKTGFVKAKVARQTAAKADAPAPAPVIDQATIEAIAAHVAALLGATHE